MEAQAKDSEDESEDVGRGSSSGRRIGRSTPVTEIRTKSHVDSAVNAPVRGPTISTSNTEGATGRHFGTPEQSMKAEDASTKSFDIRAESGSAPDTKYATVLLMVMPIKLTPIAFTRVRMMRLLQIRSVGLKLKITKGILTLGLVPSVLPMYIKALLLLF